MPAQVLMEEAGRGGWRGDWGKLCGLLGRCVYRNLVRSLTLSALYGLHQASQQQQQQHFSMCVERVFSISKKKNKER